MRLNGFTLLSILAILSGILSPVLFAQKNKTYPASPFPDRVILGFKGDPAHSQAVSWRTDATILNAMAAIHEADPSPDFQPKATVVRATSQQVTLDGSLVTFHEVNFTDLKPATQYVYRVGNGSYWSEWFQFTTASEKREPVSVLYFGDAQNDIRSMWSRAIRGAFSKMPKANLIIHAGDLVNHSYTDAEWGEWFEAGGWINGMVANLPSPGNHEYVGDGTEIRKLSGHWRPQFALPENGPEGLAETAYYIDYQGIRFISFDTEAGLQQASVMDRQIAWLEKVLRENTNRWTVMIHHHPVLSTNSSKKRSNDDWHTKLELLYKKYKVDIALQGHEHTYARGVNIPIGQSRKKPDGPVYVVSVSGPKMSGLAPQDWMDRAAANTQLYQTITISEDKLSYQAFTVSGDLYDTFELIKNRKGVNRLKELSTEIKIRERVELPERMLKSLKEEDLKEYNERFRAYKKRKGLN
ncbi:3',5'-cyclic adenosine monophosphate phosphodiesterase CpdA [Dyadobacter sp. CECT 9275]|uniref:3',5'-cyclic adenosine monophosphate phosphodiesterase CpdA n=1 Tax=Dyadobacter helix TaxID=2822344 RepID=A0A916JDQ3_9BACT|nr:metallophosphoesterase family protein [Dyadobacter sp. CECT 9275]CAG5002065.1 3',5'-cyclic adenosine monophosphate phosphodiesterase CpdA [Dyadobacter sp. CECT 9275]